MKFRCLLQRYRSGSQEPSLLRLLFGASLGSCLAGRRKSTRFPWPRFGPSVACGVRRVRRTEAAVWRGPESGGRILHAPASAHTMPPRSREDRPGFWRPVFGECGAGRRAHLSRESIRGQASIGSEWARARGSAASPKRDRDHEHPLGKSGTARAARSPWTRAHVTVSSLVAVSSP